MPRGILEPAPPFQGHRPGGEWARHLTGLHAQGHGGIPQWESQHVPMGRDDARRPPALRAQRIERRQAWRPATPLALWRRAPHARAGQGTAPHALGKGAASASSAHLIRFVVNTSDQNDTWGAVSLCSLLSIIKSKPNQLKTNQQEQVAVGSYILERNSANGLRSNEERSASATNTRASIAIPDSDLLLAARA